jgi:hypothetical protein
VAARTCIVTVTWLQARAVRVRTEPKRRTAGET